MNGKKFLRNVKTILVLAMFLFSCAIIKPEITKPESMIDPPIFPGCKGDKVKLRACMQKGIQKHIFANFDIGLAEELGLSPGRKRIFVAFIIDFKGNIVEVRVRAPHPRLKKEVENAVKSLPRMAPGKQRGRPVGVKYILPILFLVE